MKREVHKHVRKKLSLGNLIMLFVGILVLFAILKYMGAGNIIRILKTIDPWYIIFFLYLKTLSYMVWNYKWDLLIEEFTPAMYMKTLPVFMAGLLINNLTPSPAMGGEPVKAYYLSKQIKKSYSECLAITAMDTAVNLLVFLGFTIFSVIYLIFFVSAPVIVSLVKAIVITLVVIGAVLLYFSRRQKSTFSEKTDKFFWWIYNHKLFSFLKIKFKNYEDFRNYINQKIKSFKDTLKLMWKNKRRLFFVILFAIISTLFTYARTYVIFAGMDYPIRFVEVIVALTISGFIGYYAFLPGGTGAIEAIMIMIFTAMGVNPGVAAAVTLLDRTLFYIYTYGIGYVSLSYLRFKYK